MGHRYPYNLPLFREDSESKLRKRDGEEPCSEVIMRDYKLSLGSTEFEIPVGISSRKGHFWNSGRCQGGEIWLLVTWR